MFNDKELIDNIHEFLSANRAELSALKTLFLANTNAAALFVTPSTVAHFFNQLAYCEQLESINLSGCNLKDADLTAQFESKSLTSILQAAPLLRTVTLRNNSLSEAAICEFEAKLNSSGTKCQIIAPGAKSCPPAFTENQENWIPAENYTANEYLEMIEVAEQRAYKQPTLKKIHAFRAANNPKKNSQLELENLESTLPVSALLINGRAFLLPKYKSATPAVQAYNLDRDNRKSHFQKKVTLLIHKPFIYSSDPNQLSVHIVKIYGLGLIRSIKDAEKIASSMENETHALFRYGDYPLTIRRSYANDNLTKLQRKRYLVTEYISGPDCFQNLEKIHSQLISAPHNYQTITMLDEQYKRDNIRLCLAFALEVMTLHFSGIIHGDLKPEHLIITTPDDFRAIDLGLSVAHDRLGKVIDIECGTPSYMAPEIINSPSHDQTPQIDAYAFGTTARQHLYPVSHVTAERCFLFMNEPRSPYFNLKNGRATLAEHFYKGIAANYSVSVATIINQLTDITPSKRLSVSSAFSKLASIYPDIAKVALLEKIKRLHSSIENFISTFEQAGTLIRGNFSNWKDIPNVDSLVHRKTREAMLNYYCKLLTLNFFLKTFYYCNGQLPATTYEILARSVKELSETFNGNCSELTSIYYTNPSIEDNMQYHFRVMNFMLNSFALCARDKLAATNPEAANKLCLLQAQIRNLWIAKSSITEIATFAVEEYNKILDEISNVAVTTIKTELQNFIDSMQTDIIPVQSPKLMRLAYT